MPKFDYSKMQAMASSLLDDFQQGEIVLVKKGANTPAVNEWDEPTQAPDIEYKLKATAKGVSQKYVNNETILATDIEITASVFEQSPNTGDIIKIDGKPLTILQLMPTPAAGITCAWTMIAR